MYQNKIIKNLQQLNTHISLFVEKFKRCDNPNLFENAISEGGIYIITYIPQPKYVYIGQATNFNKRYSQHCEDLSAGKHCGFFGTFFKDHNCSIEDFEFKVLEYIPNDRQKAKDIAEREWIKKYDNDGQHILLNSIKYKGEY